MVFFHFLITGHQIAKEAIQVSKHQLNSLPVDQSRGCAASATITNNCLLFSYVHTVTGDDFKVNVGL